MSENWICLHRKLIGSEVFKHPHLFRFFTYLLLKVSDECEEVQVSTPEGPVTVEVCGGEIAIDYDKIHQDLEIKKAATQENLRKLKSLGIIKIFTQGGVDRAIFENYEAYQSGRDRAGSRSYFEEIGLGDEIDLTQFRPCKLSTLSFIRMWARYVRAYEKKQGKMSRQFAEACLSKLEKKFGDSPIMAERAVETEVKKLQRPSAKQVNEDPKLAEFKKIYPSVRKSRPSALNNAWALAIETMLSEEVVRIGSFSHSFSSEEEVKDFLINRAAKYADSEVVENDGGKYVPGPSSWLNKQGYLETQWDKDLSKNGSKQTGVKNSREAEEFLKENERRRRAQGNAGNK